MDQGVNLCAQENVGQGMLWLGRSLAMARRAGDADLERVCRANLAAWRYRVDQARPLG